MSDIVFWACFGVSVPAAVMVVTRRNPVYSALWLLVCFLAFAGVFLTLSAPFLAAIHVLVYTGAILVPFLFVIMLLNLRQEELGLEYPRWVQGLAALICVGVGAGVVFVLAKSEEVGPGFAAVSDEFGGVREVGRTLFGGFVLHFELVGILLLVAMIGAMLMARKKI